MERDDATIRDLLDFQESWYCRFVLGDELPPVDGSPAVSRYLDTLPGEGEMAADERQASLMRELREARRCIDEATADERRLVNEIKDSMVGSRVLVGDRFRVNWPFVKGRRTTDWKGVAAELSSGLSPEEQHAIAERHTTTGGPGRQFRPTWTDEED